MYTILMVVHSIIVLFLIMIVLVQRTDSDGMSGLGGGGGGNQFLTGRSAANLLTRTTAILAGIFMLTSLALAIMGNRMTGRSIIDTVPVEEPLSKEAAPANAVPKESPADVVKEKKESKPAVPKPE